jgi:hypothetical protein
MSAGRVKGAGGLDFLRVVAGVEGLTVLLGWLRRCWPFVAVAWEGVKLERPQAEPRAAEPRTNELDADERRRMIAGEEAG